MLIPVRCFTCGSTLSCRVWPKYKASVANGESCAEVLMRLEVHRTCCRRMLMCHKDEPDPIGGAKVSSNSTSCSAKTSAR